MAAAVGVREGGRPVSEGGGREAPNAEGVPEGMNDGSRLPPRQRLGSPVRGL